MASLLSVRGGCSPGLCYQDTPPGLKNPWETDERTMKIFRWECPSALDRGHQIPPVVEVDGADLASGDLRDLVQAQAIGDGGHQGEGHPVPPGPAGPAPAYAGSTSLFRGSSRAHSR